MSTAASGSSSLRRPIGFVVLGAALWGLAAVMAILTDDADLVWLELIWGLVAVVGIVLGLGGLFVAAWALIRRR